MRERLYRSRDDRILFGVAGGMAEWMDLDPAIVRLVWALLILAGGVGLLLYIVAAIVIPDAPWDVAYPGAAPSGGPAPAGDATADAAAPGAAAAGASMSPQQARWEARRQRRAARGANGNGGMIFGIILVVLGAWFLLDRYIPQLDLSWVGPGALIVIGLVLVLGAVGRSRAGG